MSLARGLVRIPVLRDVSMELAPAELFAVYGRRAAGKTTLLEIAAGLTPPDTGSVIFDGRDLAKISRRELAFLHREKIGWVERAGPQTTDVPMHVYVAMALYRTLSRREAHDHAMRILHRVGAGHYAGALWSDLPDTARMFVAIAQALVREPKLLIVDDPVYGLGITEREEVIGLLREVAEQAGVAVLLAVPELPAMLHAHQVRVLANGKLIGPPPDDAGTVLEFPRTQWSA
ncbi:MAG TPA: ATP-binding cassette domain-containing protein [Thermoleophilaceae bacterium]|nr:ATP-binding cassette domain-containing protein [Thermoleophilaceae bacterium]